MAVASGKRSTKSQPPPKNLPPPTFDPSPVIDGTWDDAWDDAWDYAFADTGDEPNGPESVRPYFLSF